LSTENIDFVEIITIALSKIESINQSPIIYKSTA